VALSDEQLRPLVIQAFDLKGSPYLIDAIDAIVDAHARAPLTCLEQRQERAALLIRLLRETDPVLAVGRKAA
jgi:hypothetical protein